MKNRLLLIIALFLFVGSIQAGEQVMIWVEFSDKKNSPYSLSKPHEFLSQRAIERRQKHNIPIDFYDIPVSSQYIDSILGVTTLQLFYTSRWFNGAMFKAENTDALQAIHEYDFVTFTEIAKSQTFVKSRKSGSQQLELETDFVLEKSISQHAEGNFPFSAQINQNWHTGYGAAENQVTMLNGQSIHEKGFWGEEKVIGILDSGFRSVDTLRAFDDLWMQGRILGYYDFVQAKKELYLGHHHGTVVFSVMGAYLPEIYSGVSPYASYWLLRTEDASSEFRFEEYNWLAGAEFADSVGVDIINSSLGYTVFDNASQNYTYQDLDGHTTVVARAANMAFSRGILVVNSAGNYGSQAWQYIGSPADGHGVLAVGGTDSQGTRVAFSSVGPTADGRIKPQIMAQGQGVSVVNAMGTLSNANGTSFSAPLISGMAACLWEMYPDATNNQIKQAIISGSDRYLDPDSLYGFGIPDFGTASQLLEKQLDDTRVLKLVNNPLQPGSAISFYAYQQETISIDMFNSNGRKIWTQTNIAVYPGFNELKPFSDISTLSSGIYLIRVNFKNRSELLKAIKL